jgi:hypothetical protein
MKEIKNAAGCALVRRGKVNWLVAFSCVAFGQVSCAKVALSSLCLGSGINWAKLRAHVTCILRSIRCRKNHSQPTRRESEQKVNADVWTTPSRVWMEGWIGGRCIWMHHFFQLLESSERGRLPVNFTLSAAAAQARFLCAAINFYVGTLFRQRSSFSN